MKKQIRRFSPHQNGKVIGILACISSLLFVIPISTIMLLVTPALDKHNNPMVFPKFLFIFFPLIYLVFGYITTAIACLIYNFLFRFIGGVEYEVTNEIVQQTGAQE